VPAGTRLLGGAKEAHPAPRWRGRNLPSYIPRDLFSAVLTELYEKGEVNDRVQQAIGTISRATGFDPSATRKGIENWYDNAMDRAAGWYRRRTQGRLLWMGLLVAVLANVNSVTIANYLAHAPEARKAAVQIATDASAKAPGWLAAGKAGDEGRNATTPAAAAAPASDAYYQDYKAQLEKIGVPIGWSDASRKQTLAGFQNTGWVRWLLALFLLAVGYLTTALAIMLGAPFWFDLLGRLIVIRSTVKPNEKSPDEASKDAHAEAARPATQAAGGGAAEPDAIVAGDGGGEGGGEQLVYG